MERERKREEEEAVAAANPSSKKLLQIENAEEKRFHISKGKNK